MVRRIDRWGRSTDDGDLLLDGTGPWPSPDSHTVLSTCRPSGIARVPLQGCMLPMPG